MNGAVWSYSESAPVANEVASAAEGLARSLSAEATAVEIGEPRAAVKAGEKLLIMGPKPGPSPEVAAEAIGRAFQMHRPRVIVIGATRDGRETAGRLAATLNLGCLSEATRLSVEAGSLLGERSAFAGKVLARVRTSLPAVATVKVGAFEQVRASEGKVSEVDVGPVEGKLTLIERRKKEAGTVDLKSARIIVSAGRGVKKKEDLAMLQGLADDLGGALGCSRPISSDLGWLPEEHHIGLTGVTVKPDLYVAVGISGQLQHIAGMKDSKVVVAVNTDKDAPIFQAADYGIVGDLYQVVPAIRAQLAARRKP